MYPKVFEKCMFRKMPHYMDNVLYKDQCGVREGYSTQ